MQRREGHALPAVTYGSTEVFVNLSAWSRLLVTKAMAGTRSATRPTGRAEVARAHSLRTWLERPIRDMAALRG